MEKNEFISRVDKWDQKIILKYNGIGGKAFTYLLKPISFLGRETLWISLIAFYLFIWYDPLLFAHFSAIFLNGFIFIFSIKQIVKRSRPFDKFNENKLHVLERRPISKSFPSWHSYNIVSYGLLFGFLLNSPLLILVMLCIAVIVSFSRIQIGVHYPTDVIFGYILGIIGFISAIYIVSPLLNMLITCFEQLFPQNIQYQQINTMLIKDIWYLFLCIFIFLGIFLLAISRVIKEYIKKSNT
ncbi:MAG: phosphatase PAP2 family protein [Candidatus Hodarchaeota archaeon]